MLGIPPVLADVHTSAADSRRSEAARDERQGIQRGRSHLSSCSSNLSADIYIYIYIHSNSICLHRRRANRTSAGKSMMGLG